MFQKEIIASVLDFRYWRIRPILKGKAFRMSSSTDLDGAEMRSFRLKESRASRRMIRMEQLAQYDAQTEENGKTSHRLNVHVQGIPALGYKTIWLKRPAGNQAVAENSTTVFANSWETDHYKVSFNERGEITSLWDKEAHREVVKPGEAANRFHFFHDRPTLWDAWDIDTRYEEQLAERRS